MIKNIISTYLMIITAFSITQGQISINISPTYNYFASPRSLGVAQGIGIETGIRFNSSKGFRYGFDIGYNQGTIAEPDTYIISTDSTLIPIIGFKSSLIPIQVIGEFRRNRKKHNF